MRAFEIHTFQGGKWKIDSIFDDRDLAVFEAQRMEGSKRHLGIRVVEETFDENTQQTAVRTIYKGTAVDSPSQAEPKKQQSGAKGGKPVAKGGGGQIRRGKAPPPPKASKSNSLLLAIFSIIIIVGAGAIIALRLLSPGM